MAKGAQGNLERGGDGIPKFSGKSVFSQSFLMYPAWFQFLFLCEKAARSEAGMPLVPKLLSGLWRHFATQPLQCCSNHFCLKFKKCLQN